MRYLASEKLEIIRLVDGTPCRCGRERSASRTPPSIAGTICTTP